MQRLMKRILVAVVAVAAVLAVPRNAAAHCDALDGPVVKAAQRALATGEVGHALAWVQPEGEAEIREAFERTLEARLAGGKAAELADRWFFETLVRVHRQGEGEPYTGLKPAGGPIEAGIVAAEKTLTAGSVEPLAKGAGEELSAVLRAKFAEVQALAKHDPADAAAGRRYVHAYADYIHFVEQVHALLHGGAHAEKH